MTESFSQACLTIPPVVAEGYEPKGQYSTSNDVKLYTVGSKTAKTAIVYLYDVFGYAPQTIQGADLLAGAGYLVLMPDLLVGKAFDASVMSMSAEEKQAFRAKFFGEGGPGYRPDVLSRVVAAVETIKSKYPDVKNITSLGLCFGGKMAVLTSNEPYSLFVASAQTHPSQLAKEDAEALKIPHLILASKDENPDDVKFYDPAKMPAGSEVHTYSTMPHGWMGARADLKSEEPCKEYTRGYEQVANWFAKVLQ